MCAREQLSATIDLGCYVCEQPFSPGPRTAATSASSRSRLGRATGDALATEGGGGDEVSTISSLIITCSIMEKDAITALNAWSQQLDCPVEFVQLDLDEAADAGLNKALQIDVYAAAQNQFDEQALLTM